MRRTRLVPVLTTVIGSALVLTSCSGSVYDVPLPGGADLGDDPYELVLEFDDVLDLVPQSGVRVADVPVGKVTDIEVDDWHAIVTVEINDDVELPANTTASIRQTSILGEKFVSLDSPAEPATGTVGDGDVLELDATGRNPEIEEVLGALSLVLNGGSVSQLQTISRELNATFDGRERRIRGLLRRLDSFLGEIDDSRPELVEALERIDDLGEAAVDQQDAIADALDRLPDALRTLERQRDGFVDMLESLDELGDTATGVIQQSKDDIVANLNDLAPLLENLEASGDDIVTALEILPTNPYPDGLIGDTPAAAQSYEGGTFLEADVIVKTDYDRVIDTMTPEQYAAFTEFLRDPPSPFSAPIDPDDALEPADPTGTALNRLYLGEAP